MVIAYEFTRANVDIHIYLIFRQNGLSKQCRPKVLIGLGAV